MIDAREWEGRIYEGDCLEFMRGLPDGCVDLVLTDPPYGIASVWKGGRGHGWARARAQGVVRNQWDETPCPEVFSEPRKGSRCALIPGCVFVQPDHPAP